MGRTTDTRPRAYKVITCTIFHLEMKGVRSITRPSMTLQRNGGDLIMDYNDFKANPRNGRQSPYKVDLNQFFKMSSGHLLYTKLYFTTRGYYDNIEIFVQE